MPASVLSPGSFAHFRSSIRVAAISASLLMLMGWGIGGDGRAVVAAETPAPKKGLPPSSLPALEVAAQALVAGQLDQARTGFEAIQSDAGQPAYARALAGLGAARTALARGERATAMAAYERVATNASLPRPFREAAARLVAGVRSQAGSLSDASASTRPTLPVVPTSARVFSVESSGDDAGDGSTARPFRTVERARDAVRAWRREQGAKASDGGVVIEVGSGRFPVSHTLVLGTEEAGSANAPFVVRARPGNSPVLSGGLAVRGWAPLADAVVRNRLDPAARDRVLVADLKGLGLEDYGDATTLRRQPELFVDGVPQMLARWPNEGFVKTGEILGKETFKVWNSIAGCKDGVFRYVDARATNWVDEPDVRLYGYWFWDWYEEFQKVVGNDPVTQTFTLGQPYSQYGYRKEARYYALNVLRELDRPGEWYLDRRDGRLFWYPPAGVDVARADIVLSVLDQPFVELRDTRHVVLLGLTFEAGRGDGIHIRGGASNLVAGCTLRRLGGDAIVCASGAGHGVFGCALETLGCGGVQLAAGNRDTLEPGGQFVENCLVRDISRLKRTYTPAVHVDGCGQRIAHNLFERMPSSALRVEGNDHLVELNLIRHVVEESDDQGGIDMFGNPLYRGVVIRWNRWSDIRGGTHNGAAGVRLDDMISGVSVYGNVFERCGAVIFGGVQIHGGKDNWVDGNVLVDCFAGMSFSRWGSARWLQGIEPFLPKLTPVQLERYPELATLKTNADVNVVTRNAFLGCREVFLRDGGLEQSALNVTGEGTVDLSTLCRGDHPLALGMLLDPIPLAEIGPYAHPWRLAGVAAPR